jgi:hypothetical protein
VHFRAHRTKTVKTLVLFLCRKPTDDMENEKNQRKRLPPIPWWAWVFAAGCAILPVLTLGGAIPGGVGFGGAAGCVAAARDSRMPVGVRIAICTLIVLAAWGIVIAVVGTIALLQRK